MSTTFPYLHLITCELILPHLCLLWKGSDLQFKGCAVSVKTNFYHGLGEEKERVSPVG